MALTDIIKEIKEKLPEGKDVSQATIGLVLDALMKEILPAHLQKDGEFTLYGVGTFKVVARAEREGRNPSTGEAIHIPAKNAVKFTAAKPLKEAAANFNN